MKKLPRMLKRLDEKGVYPWLLDRFPLHSGAVLKERALHFIAAKTKEAHGKDFPVDYRATSKQPPELWLVTLRSRIAFSLG